MHFQSYGLFYSKLYLIMDAVVWRLRKSVYLSFRVFCCVFKSVQEFFVTKKMKYQLVCKFWIRNTVIFETFLRAEYIFILDFFLESEIPDKNSVDLILFYIVIRFESELLSSRLGLRMGKRCLIWRTCLQVRYVGR